MSKMDFHLGVGEMQFIFCLLLTSAPHDKDSAEQSRAQGPSC